MLPREGNLSLKTLRGKRNTWKKVFGKFLPDDRNIWILDAGCGTGKLLWWLQDMGYIHAEGIDIDSEQIAVAQKLGIVNVRRADLREYLGYKKEKYDIIFLRDILEHFKKEYLLEILTLCKNSLKDAGKVIIQTPNAESPFFGRVRYGDLTHEIAFSQSSLSQLLLLSGFKSIHFFPLEPVFKGMKSAARFLKWKMAQWLLKNFLYAELGHFNTIVTQNLIALAEKGMY